MGLFGLDSTFFKVGTKVFDILLLMLLWMLISILGFGITFGVTTTAVYYVIDKSIIHDRGYILKNFFASFKLNFIKATVISLILASGKILIIFNLNYAIPQSNVGFVFIALQWSILIELIFLSIYAYPILAKMDLSIKDVLKNAFYMANKHILISLLALVVVGVVVVLGVFVNALLIAPAGIMGMMIISKLVVGGVLPKYIDKEKLENFKY